MRNGLTIDGNFHQLHLNVTAHSKVICFGGANDESKRERERKEEEKIESNFTHDEVHKQWHMKRRVYQAIKDKVSNRANSK